MMTLYVLGSGSRGNCFAVEAEGVALLIDAGFSAREIERRAETAGLDLSAGGRHRSDPRARRPRVRRAAAGPAPGCAGADRAGTWDRLVPRHGGAELRPLGPAPGRAGPFIIEACPTSHDAAEPLAVVVRTGMGPASAWPTIWAGRPPRCAICFGTSPPSCWRPTTTRSSCAPASIRRWCSAGSPAPVATCQPGRG